MRPWLEERALNCLIVFRTKLLMQLDSPALCADAIGPHLYESLERGLCAIRAGGDVFKCRGEVEGTDVGFDAKDFGAAVVEEQDGRGIGDLLFPDPVGCRQFAAVRRDDWIAIVQCEPRDVDPVDQLTDFGFAETVAMYFVARCA